MKIPMFQVDVFTSDKFRGNTADVCILDSWIEDGKLQQIAVKNNLSETAFPVKNKNRFQLRWFTPEAKIDLCGYATLASAYIVFEYIDRSLKKVELDTKSHKLISNKTDSLLSMNFPSRPAKTVNYPGILHRSINIKPKKVLKSRDYLLIYDNEKKIKKIKLDFKLLKKVNTLGEIVTSESSQYKKYDFKLSFFAPSLGIEKDPMTGSSHTTLIPCWAKKLNKNRMIAYQYSK